MSDCFCIRLSYESRTNHHKNSKRYKSPKDLAMSPPDANKLPPAPVVVTGPVSFPRASIDIRHDSVLSYCLVQIKLDLIADETYGNRTYFNIQDGVTAKVQLSLPSESTIVKCELLCDGQNISAVPFPREVPDFSTSDNEFGNKICCGAGEESAEKAPSSKSRLQDFTIDVEPIFVNEPTVFTLTYTQPVSCDFASAKHGSSIKEGDNRSNTISTTTSTARNSTGRSIRGFLDLPFLFDSDVEVRMRLDGGGWSDQGRSSQGYRVNKLPMAPRWILDNLHDIATSNQKFGGFFDSHTLPGMGRHFAVPLPFVRKPAEFLHATEMQAGRIPGIVWDCGRGVDLEARIQTLKSLPQDMVVRIIFLGSELFGLRAASVCDILLFLRSEDVASLSLGVAGADLSKLPQCFDALRKDLKSVDSFIVFTASGDFLGRPLLQQINNVNEENGVKDVSIIVDDKSMLSEATSAVYSLGGDCALVSGEPFPDAASRNIRPVVYTPDLSNTNIESCHLISTCHGQPILVGSLRENCSSLKLTITNPFSDASSCITNTNSSGSNASSSESNRIRQSMSSCVLDSSKNTLVMEERSAVPGLISMLTGVTRMKSNDVAAPRLYSLCPPEMTFAFCHDPHELARLPLIPKCHPAWPETFSIQESCRNLQRERLVTTADSLQSYMSNPTDQTCANKLSYRPNCTPTPAPKRFKRLSRQSSLCNTPVASPGFGEFPLPLPSASHSHSGIKNRNVNGLAPTHLDGAEPPFLANINASLARKLLGSGTRRKLARNLSSRKFEIRSRVRIPTLNIVGKKWLSQRPFAGPAFGRVCHRRVLPDPGERSGVARPRLRKDDE